MFYTAYGCYSLRLFKFNTKADKQFKQKYLSLHVLYLLRRKVTKRGRNNIMKKTDQEDTELVSTESSTE